MTKSMQLFETGSIFLTRSVADATAKSDRLHFFVKASLRRHQSQDFGDLDIDDLNANLAALINGDRILSAYNFTYADIKIWIITEADRSITTILFPSDY